MLGTATITGIFYGTDGAAVTNADVYIVPQQKYLASVSGAAWAPRPITGRTDATGAIGRLDGDTFTAGIPLGMGKHNISVRKDGTSHNGTITVDETKIAAGAADLHDAMQPAPTPEMLSAAQLALEDTLLARDKAQEWAENPEDTPVEAGQFSALHHAARAQKWAENPEDTEVEPGKFSGLHHAAKGEAFAAAAAASASSAATSESNTQSLLNESGVLPVGAEILWPSGRAFPSDFTDTGLRLLSGASERAILVFFTPKMLFSGGAEGTRMTATETTL